MKVIIFGASGMVGQGVLRESVLDAQVQDILLIGRSGSGLSGGKVHEIVQPDLLQIETLASRLAGYDACFFCLGVSSAGMNEASNPATSKIDRRPKMVLGRCICFALYRVAAN